MAVTTNDIEAIINGAPIEIETPYPLDDKAPGFQWYMAQPDDWLYDMASAVREAADGRGDGPAGNQSGGASSPRPKPGCCGKCGRRRPLSARLPSFRRSRPLPQRKTWSWLALTANLLNLIDPTTYNRAKEIVATRAQAGPMNPT
jgi:hypothetical protein